jgi:hypothetical protein
MRRSVLVWTLGWLGCTATPARVEGDPQPVEANRNGGAGGEVAASSPVPSFGPALPDTYVWCDTGDGASCARVLAALGGTLIKDPARAPAQLYVVEDVADDCGAVGMPELRRRIGAALAIDPAGWRDQLGADLPAAEFPNVYAAAGCIADATGSGAVIKLSASSTSAPRSYLVRVWEASYAGAGY